MVSYSYDRPFAHSSLVLYTDSTWYGRSDSALLPLGIVEKLEFPARALRAVLPCLNLDDSLRTGNGSAYLPFDGARSRCRLGQVLS